MLQISPTLPSNTKPVKAVDILTAEQCLRDRVESARRNLTAREFVDLLMDVSFAIQRETHAINESRPDDQSIAFALAIIR